MSKHPSVDKGRSISASVLRRRRVGLLTMARLLTGLQKLRYWTAQVLLSLD